MDVRSNAIEIAERNKFESLSVKAKIYLYREQSRVEGISDSEISRIEKLVKERDQFEDKGEAFVAKKVFKEIVNSNLTLFKK